MPIYSRCNTHSNLFKCISTLNMRVYDIYENISIQTRPYCDYTSDNVSFTHMSSKDMHYTESVSPSYEAELSYSCAIRCKRVREWLGPENRVPSWGLDKMLPSRYKRMQTNPDAPPHVGGPPSRCVSIRHRQTGHGKSRWSHRPGSSSKFIQARLT